MLRFAISPLGDGEYEADRISDKAETLEDATREVTENVAPGDPVIAIVHIKGGAVDIEEELIEREYEALLQALGLFGRERYYNFLDLLVEQGFKAGMNYAIALRNS